jgi:hypothetical protein
MVKPSAGYCSASFPRGGLVTPHPGTGFLEKHTFDRHRRHSSLPTQQAIPPAAPTSTRFEECPVRVPGRSRSECIHLRIDSLARTIGVIRGIPSGSALIVRLSAARTAGTGSHGRAECRPSPSRYSRRSRPRNCHPASLGSPTSGPGPRRARFHPGHPR